MISAPAIAPRPLPSRVAPRGTGSLSVLFEAPAGPAASLRGGLPVDLNQAYGGELTIPLRDDRPTVIANFVETLDGVVALDPFGNTDGGAVSGFSPTDRFVMGLLRAMADVVLVGAGTVRASTGTGWTPASAHPQAAESYRDLRRRLGLAADPTTLVVTASGDLDPGHRAFHGTDSPVVIAGPSSAVDRLRGSGLPAAVRLESLGEGDGVAWPALIDLIGRWGSRLVLSEGGPHVVAGLAGEGLLDELFLTLAPQLVGRDRDARRLALLEGVALWPERAAWGGLVSVRRAGDHLFLRYRLPEGPS